MAQPSIHGRFIWQELMTADTAAAGEFYSKVIGWRTQPFPKTDSSYSTFVADGAPVGGLTRLAEDARQTGARPHWLPFIGSDDVDATSVAVERLGGKVLRSPTNIDNVGRYAVLADPQGASFGAYKPQQSGSFPARGHARPGEFAWQELATSDYEAAFRFYGELFGWQALQRMDMGPAGTYLIFGRDGVQQGGIYKLSAQMPAPYWLSYIETANVEAAAAAARDAGGRVITGPMDVPGGGRIAQLLDASGVLFAVHAAAKAAAPAKAPASAKTPAKQAVPKPTATNAPATKAAVAAASAAPTRPAAKKASARKGAAKRAPMKKAPTRKVSKKKMPVTRAAAKQAAAKRRVGRTTGKAARKTAGNGTARRATTTKAKVSARRAARPKSPSRPMRGSATRQKRSPTRRSRGR